MQILLFSLLCMALCCLASGAHASSEERSFVYDVRHTIAPGSEFTPRGTCTVTYTKSGSRGGSSVEFSEVALSGAEYAAFAQWAGQKGFYRLELCPQGSSDGCLVTSVPACTQTETQFKQFLTLHVDIYGSLLGVDFEMSDGNCHADAAYAARAVQDAVSVTTRARVGLGHVGEAPKDVRSAQMLWEQAESKKNPDGSTKPEEKSFFQKYWMYLAIGGVVMMMGGGGK